MSYMFLRILALICIATCQKAVLAHVRSHLMQLYPEISTMLLPSVASLTPNMCGLAA